MKLFVCRVQVGKGRQWWFFNEESVLKGRNGESFQDVMDWWKHTFGAPTGFTCYRRIRTESDAEQFILKIRKRWFGEGVRES